MTKKNKEIEILYEDEHLIAVNKPAGMLTLPDRFQEDRPNLYRQLQQRYPTLFVVHRLDKDTSGVILFALDAITHAALSKAFEEHRIKKTYVALVLGHVTPHEGTIDRPIIPHPADDGRMTTAAKGKRAVTHYQAIRHFRKYTWMSLDIETGRTHQIRVHMAWIKHPLAVDPLYGGDEGVFLSEIKEKYKPNRGEAEHPLIERVPLHASRIAFTHPASGKEMSIEAPMPKDLRATLNQLERWG